jgi:PAS domain S-box-containing protein
MAPAHYRPNNSALDMAILTSSYSNKRRWVQYALAIVAVSLAGLARQLANPLFGSDRLPFIFFFPAVAVATWCGGLGPGVLAAVLSGVAADWFHIGTKGSLGVQAPFDAGALLAYGISSAFIIGAIQIMHRAQRRLLVEIEQRQKAELKVIEEKEVLSTTLTSIGDAVIATDTAGLITFVNPEAERLTGWSATEAVGQPLSNIFRIFNEFSREPVENPVKKVLRCGVTVGLTNHTVLVAKDGKELPIDDSAAPIRHSNGSLSGVILVFRDFSERKAAQKTSAQLAAIVEFSGDVILAKDLNGVIQSWNAAAERLFGYRAEEIIGKHVTVLFPPERLSEEDHILGRLRAGNAVERLETVRTTKDGKNIPVAVSISPIRDPEGRIVGASKILQDITSLVAAREALVEEKELLATTLTSIGDAVILTDAQGRVTLLNPEAERLTGWSRSEATGRLLGEVFRIVHEETRAPAEDPVGKVMSAGAVVGLSDHTILIAKDGTETSIDDSAAPIRRDGAPLRGVVLVFRDFSQQRRAQRQQEDVYRLVQAVNQARVLPEVYEAALDAATRRYATDRCSISFLDADGIMRFKAWRGLSDTCRQGVEGYSPWSAEQSHPQPVSISMAAMLEPELRRVVEKEGIRSLALVPISYEGKLLGELALYFNKTRELTQEEERLAVTLASQVALAVQRHRAAEQLESEVRDRTAKLQEMMTELQHVSYAITHDMRAPLRAMSTFAGIIMDELKAASGTAPELLDAGRRIIASASRLDQLIQDSLNYTKAVLQQVPLHPVDLSRLIPSLIETYPNLQSDKADITVEDSLPTVLGEESLLTQCFSNLLGNAVKFVPKGTHPKVRVRVEILDNTARIAIEDNGIGIPKEAQTRLFGMFERLTTGYEGTGIGLAIVRKVVERMGGKVGVESKPGQGSKFWVELRVAPPGTVENRRSRSYVKP